MSNIEIIISMFEEWLNNSAYIIFPSIIGVILLVGLYLLIYSYVNEHIFKEKLLKWNLIIGKIKNVKSYTSKGTEMYSAVIEYKINDKLYKYESNFSSTSYPEINKNVNLLVNPLNYNDVVEADLKLFLLYRFIGLFFIIPIIVFVIPFICIYYQHDCHSLKELFYYISQNN